MCAACRRRWGESRPCRVLLCVGEADSASEPMGAFEVGLPLVCYRPAAPAEHGAAAESGLGVRAALVACAAGTDRCCDKVWISKALTTMTTPSSSCAAGGAPSAALISMADTGTTLRNAVPVTTPSVFTPKLNARIATTDGMAPM